jgi:hypothetical protein
MSPRWWWPWAVLVLAVAACGSRDQRAHTSRLVDGSAPPVPPGALGSLAGDVVMSRVRFRRAARLDTRGQECITSFRGEFAVANDALVVERTGAIGASLTFLDARRRIVLGCDRTGRRVAGAAWCARSVGRLVAGRLIDPRLDILCLGRHREPIGFAWIEPMPATRWVVVGDGTGSEVEPVAAGLPVRVATRDVDLATSSATFAVSEYDATGAELARYRLPLRVAG